MTVRGRSGIAVTAVLSLLIMVLPSAATAQAQPGDPAAIRCPGVQLAPPLHKDPDRNPDGSDVKITPDSRGKFVPVIMIHGWTGRSTHTEKRDGAFSHRIDLSTNQLATVKPDRSLIGQLQRNPGAAVFTFDYHDYSARWIDDPHIGPALGDAIDCLYKAFGEKVIIVAHSMGGLAARYALTTTGKAGVDRAAEVSTVITFGTPNTGSLAAMLGAAGAGITALMNSQLATLRLVMAACGRLSTASLRTGTLCDRLPEPVRAFDSEVGRALRYGSRQLAALKPFPQNVTVNALAGDATFEIPKLGWFTKLWDTDKVPAGDLIVTTDSAVHGANSDMKAQCSYQLNAVRGATDTAALYLF
jgi:pimeloyl-ACP methyl ester carboxylesterase